MKKSYRIKVIIILISFLILGLNGAIITIAVPVDPSDYTLGIFIGDKRLYRYNTAESLDKFGNPINELNIPIPIGGSVVNVTVIAGDKVEVEIIDIFPNNISFIDTFYLLNGSVFTSDPINQSRNEFKIDAYIMTTNKTLVTEAMSQSTIDSWGFQSSNLEVYFENTSLKMPPDVDEFIMSYYYTKTGWPKSQSVQISNTTSGLKIMNYELNIEQPSDFVNVPVNQAHYTIGDIQVGDRGKYLLSKFSSGMGAEPGDFMNLTITNINSSYIEFEQVFYEPDGTILGTPIIGFVSRSVFQQMNPFMTTNTTLIDEALSGTISSIYYNDLIELEFDYDLADQDESRYSNIKFDSDTGWLNYMNITFSNYSTSEIMFEQEIILVDMTLADRTQVEVDVNPSYYTLGVKVDDKITAKFVKVYNYLDTDFFSAGDFTNLTIINIDANTIEIEQVFYESDGTLIYPDGTTDPLQLDVSRDVISQPNAFVMTTNVTLIKEAFADTQYDFSYSAKLMKFVLDYTNPENNLRYFCNFTYDRTSGWIETYHYKITNTTDSSLISELEAIPVKEEAPVTTEPTTEPTSTSETSKKNGITSYPGLFGLLSILSILIVYRKRRNT